MEADKRIKWVVIQKVYLWDYFIRNRSRLLGDGDILSKIDACDNIVQLTWLLYRFGIRSADQKR